VTDDESLRTYYLNLLNGEKQLAEAREYIRKQSWRAFCVTIEDRVWMHLAQASLFMKAMHPDAPSNTRATFNIPTPSETPPEEDREWLVEYFKERHMDVNFCSNGQGPFMHVSWQVNPPESLG
jgi:hypothetical protein